LIPELYHGRTPDLGETPEDLVFKPETNLKITKNLFVYILETSLLKHIKIYKSI
jgi:hypothetical protein